jgi:hypothetical protein
MYLYFIKSLKKTFILQYFEFGELLLASVG